MKKRYQSKFLYSILDAQKKDICLKKYLSSVNIKDIIFWISDACKEVSSETIFKCWKKVLPSSYYEKSVEDSAMAETTISNAELLADIHQIIGYENMTEENVQNWIESGHHYQPSNEELISIISEKYNDNIDSEDDEISSNLDLDKCLVTPEDACNSADKLLEFFKFNSDLSPSDMESIQRARDAAIRRIRKD